MGGVARDTRDTRMRREQDGQQRSDVANVSGTPPDALWARLRGVVLYGSCVRGTEDADSDMNFMILLTGQSIARKKFGASGTCSILYNSKARVCYRSCRWMRLSMRRGPTRCIARRREKVSLDDRRGRKAWVV